MNQQLERLPPHDLAAEKSVLGSILIEPARLDEVAGILEPDDLYSAANSAIYRHLLVLHAEGKPVDLGLLRSRLQEAGDWESIGGAAYLADVAHAVPVAAHAAHYAAIVQTKAQRRRLIVLANETLRSCYDERESPAAVAQGLLSRIDTVLGNEARGGLCDADEAMGEAIANAQETASGRRGGISTGLVEFDVKVGGLFPGELVILAARPRMGKTSLALAIATWTATKGRPVLFVSLEMGRAELATRILCAHAGVDGNRLRNGTLNAADVQALQASQQDLAGLALKIDDRSAVTVGQIRAEARLLQQHVGLQLVLVDYLGRLTPADPRAKRHEQVGRMTGELKTLARELAVPVVCLAQLNREAEKADKGDHRPRLAHLRESGDIEQDADVVAFLHRESVYKPDDPDLRGKAELFVEKNRNGTTGKFDLQWDGATTTFSAPSPAWEEFEEFA